MLLDPTQITVSHLMLLSQLERLQGYGYLRGTTLDFGQDLESTLQDGYQSLSHASPRVFLTPTAPFWTQENYRDKLRQVLEASMRFQPHAAADFTPMQGIVKLGLAEKPLPVVIEKVSYEQAESIASFPVARRYLDEFALLKGHDTIEPMVFLMRGWGGEVHAMAIAALHPMGSTKSMFCCRDVKFDRRERTAIRGVGAMLTLARLIYMRRLGHWTDEFPILRDIQPEVLTSYRSRFPAPPRFGVRQGEWHIERSEGEHLMLSSPFELVPLPVNLSSSS